MTGALVPMKRCERCGDRLPVHVFYPKVRQRRQDGTLLTIRDRLCAGCRRAEERRVQAAERAARPARGLPRGMDFTLVAHAMLAPGRCFAVLDRGEKQRVLVLGYELARRFAHPAHPKLKRPPETSDAEVAALMDYLDAAIEQDAVPFEAGWPENRDHDPPTIGGGGA